MAITRSIGVKPLDDVGATPLDMKQTIGALITQAKVNEPQLGILAPCDSPLVTGTDGLAYMVGKCQAALSPGPGYGAHLLTVTDATQAATVAGSPTGVRIDLVTIRQNDPDVGDSSNEPVIEVVNGDTVEANPVPPTGKVPPGALILAQVTVPSGMNATNQAGVIITVTVPYTGLRGAAIAQESIKLPKVDGWNVLGYATKKQVGSGLYEVHMNGRYQRAADAFTVTGKWMNLLPGAIPEGYRPKRNPNGDVMRSTAHAFPWWPAGDTDEGPSLQLQATDAGNIWTRSIAGNAQVRQWGFVNIVMDWLVEQ